jgi:hypothetical protein
MIPLFIIGERILLQDRALMQGCIIMTCQTVVVKKSLWLILIFVTQLILILIAWLVLEEERPRFCLGINLVHSCLMS